jgi:hypothetical protein
VISSKQYKHKEIHMNTWLKVLIVTLVVAIPAVPLGQVIWPPAMRGMEPNGIQLPLLIVISIFEAVALGLGVAFIAFGLPLVRKLAMGSGPLAWASFVSIAWFLVSWWPHDGFHRSMAPDDMSSLIAVEYGFHLTLIAAGAILAFAFWRVASRAVQATGAQPSMAGRLQENALRELS